MSDKLFLNAELITLEQNAPVFGELATKDGRILYLGAENGNTTSSSLRDVEIINCSGFTIMPGFIDTHIHLHAFARASAGFDLTMQGELSVKQIQEYVADIVRNRKPGEWITIFGYNQFNIKEKRHLTIEDLDPVSPENPVRFYHRSGQAQLFNSKALELLHITIETEEPSDGMIDRLIPSGEPSGLIFGMEGYIAKYLPDEDETFMKGAVKRAGNILSENGITAVQDTTLRNDTDRIETLLNWHVKGLMPQRIYPCLGIDAFLNKASSANISGVKMILKQQRHGMNIPSEKLCEILLDLNTAGIPGIIHCINSDQLETVLLAAERIKEQLSCDTFLRVDHASVCSPEMAERLSRAGINVSSQPGFIYYSGDRYLATVPKQDIPFLYAYATMLGSGINLSFSSDAPISPVNPFKGIYSAVSRKTTSGAAVVPEQAINIEQALHCYTINGAKQLGLSGCMGSLATGKYADFIVLDKNPLKIKTEELEDIKVLMTVINGEIVYSKI